MRSKTSPGANDAARARCCPTWPDAASLMAGQSSRHRTPMNVSDFARLRVVGATSVKARLSGYVMKRGHYWESVSRPRWDEYFSETVLIDAPYEERYCIGRYEAGNAEIIERVLSEHQRRRPMLNFKLEPIQFATDLIALEPWQATYWRTYPLGYRLVIVIGWDERFDYYEDKANIVPYPWFIPRRGRFTD